MSYLTWNSDRYPLLIEATIDALSEGLAHKTFTSVDLVKAYLARIAEVDKSLHAVTEVNPDALTIAAALDQERHEGYVRGPMHGIPLLIKDNIATKDKMNTTAGSWALLGATVIRDATVVQKLRASGAIILGKSSLTEWANLRALNSSHGWSARGGQGSSPYFPLGDPLGSSSGSGIASALGLSLGCLGTETDGSLVLPASFNNIVAIKPTVGLTSRHMVIPISQHQDTIGPMARTVKDAAYILQAIAGTDVNDNYTSEIPAGITPNYIAACRHSALSGTRLGVPKNVISLMSSDTTRPVLEAFEKALGTLRDSGATIIDTNFTAAQEFWDSNVPLSILYADFLADLHAYLESLAHNPNHISTLEDLRSFTQSFNLEDYPLRDTGHWDQALKQGWNNTDPKFWPAYQQNLFYGGSGGLLGALERENLDAILLPTDFAPNWAAPVGAPIVTVPLGRYPDGVPVVRNAWGLATSAPNVPFGLSFLGARFTEPKLIGLAFAFEQKTKIRDKVKPYIAPRTEIIDVIKKQ
ncbi:amidase [Pyrenochaeta sp. MPI-SDFR-AT-0127]|nr:amidase [Pyrenochaeta sp. MPI-SDFR-AT-0127]